LTKDPYFTEGSILRSFPFFINYSELRITFSVLGKFNHSVALAKDGEGR